MLNNVTLSSIVCSSEFTLNIHFQGFSTIRCFIVFYGIVILYVDSLVVWINPLFLSLHVSKWCGYFSHPTTHVVQKLWCVDNPHVKLLSNLACVQPSWVMYYNPYKEVTACDWSKHWHGSECPQAIRTQIPTFFCGLLNINRVRVFTNLKFILPHKLFLYYIINGQVPLTLDNHTDGGLGDL